jgi:hypothetical protein
MVSFGRKGEAGRTYVVLEESESFRVDLVILELVDGRLHEDRELIVVSHR